MMLSFAAAPALGPFPGVLLSAVIVYAAVLVLTRLGGLRSFAKLTSFDFGLTVALGSIVASAITSTDTPLAVSLAGLAALYAIHIGFAVLRRQWPWLARLADNRPILLMHGSRLLRENLRRAHVSEDDVRSQLRLAGVTDLAAIRAVVMETTGEIAVLKGGAGDAPLPPWLLDDVRTPETP